MNTGDEKKTNAPLWKPDAERIAASQLSRFQQMVEARHGLSLSGYDDLYQWSINCQADFWQAVWDFCRIQSSVRSATVAENLDKFPGTSWFPGSRLNFAENLLPHRDGHLALVGLLENGERRTFTYAELYVAVEKLASALRRQGIKAGDRVAGFMPNICETVIAMLATTSIGAVWSSCSPDFGIEGARYRFEQIEPKVLFATEAYLYNGKVVDCLEKVESLRADIPSIEKVVIVPMLDQTADLSQREGYCRYDDFVSGAPVAPLRFEQLPFDHPVYIMYSSGTTGAPKCIVHGAGGTLIEHKKEQMLHTDISRDDVLFYFTTCGWMMWNWLVSGLSCGCTLVLYDGYPFAKNGRLLLDAIDDEGISIFGTSARFIASLEKEGIKPRETHQLKRLKAILSTGSPLSENSFEYIYRDFKADVCLSSICGGTDIISCFILGNPNLPVYSGEIQCRGLGMAVEFWDDAGGPVRGEKGELVCVKPFPSTPIGFWNDPKNEKFYASYFDDYPNIWAHGDYGEITDNGGVVIHGRSDAVLNPGGVRIGTAEIYRQVEKIQEIIDSVVIGQQWQDDERVILFVVLKEGESLSDKLAIKIKSTIRQNTTPRHVPAKIITVTDIPRTISGKIVEIAVKKVVHGRSVKNTDALANPEALESFKDIPQLKEQ